MRRSPCCANPPPHHLQRPLTHASTPALGSAVRALDFDAEKHKVLESELKALYCALTRARVNVWVVDFDPNRRRAVYSWFAER